MTLRKPVPPTTLTVEYACERRCRVECDLDEVSGRTTIAALRTAAGQAHDAAHDAEPAQRAFPVGDHILVKAGQLAVTR